MRYVEYYNTVELAASTSDQKMTGSTGFVLAHAVENLAIWLAPTAGTAPGAGTINWRILMDGVPLAAYVAANNAFKTKVYTETGPIPKGTVIEVQINNTNASKFQLDVEIVGLSRQDNS